MSFLLLVFLCNSIIAETRPLWEFFLPLRTVGLHFGESRNTSYALRMVKRWISRQGNGILYGSNMSGEMHMQKRNEVFGCIPHGRGAFS